MKRHRRPTRLTTTALLTLVAFTVGCPKSGPNSTPDAGAATDTGNDTANDTEVEDLGPDAATTDVRTEDDAADASIEPDGDFEPHELVPGCSGDPPTGGDAWAGWGNLQFPRVVELVVGEPSPPIYGQVYREGATEGPGQAPDFEAQLVVGPLGAHPIDNPTCFRTFDAMFNVDVGNNDEYSTRVIPTEPGLFGMFYRYRPTDGSWAWRYGDLEGSDDGTTTDQAGVIAVDGTTTPDAIRVVTLNLRCQTDRWTERRDLVVEALVALEPHIIGLQEDCAIPGSDPQSYELIGVLAERMERGFEAFHIRTHQATYPEGTFDEGVTLLSAFPIDAHYHLELPFGNFPRVALVTDLRVAEGQLIRAVSTHFDNGAANEDARNQSAAMVAAEKDEKPIVVLGDLNTDPGSTAYDALAAAFDDAWIAGGGAGDGFTIPSDAPVRRIDYVFSSGFDVTAVETVDEVAGDLHLSDHRGVAATLAP